jgi:monoamine oxidase
MHLLPIEQTGFSHQNHIAFPSFQRLRFNTRVTKVCIDSPTAGMPSLHPVSIHTSNGTEIRARQVLVTVPLGVLQSGSIDFSPPLPQDKTDAISRFQAGLLDIVVLRFDKIFWPKDVHFFGLISDQHAATRLTLSHIVPDNQHDQDPSRWGMSTILNLSSARNDETPLLQMQVVGSDASDLECLSEKDVAMKAMKVVRTIFPDASDPIACRVSRWCDDEFARTSYAAAAVGSKV